ncbi:hypothetical protein ACTOJ1_001688 [Shigella flexneri]
MLLLETDQLLLFDDEETTDTAKALLKATFSTILLVIKVLII